jgi:hypothetical protein
MRAAAEKNDLRERREIGVRMRNFAQPGRERQNDKFDRDRATSYTQPLDRNA